VSEEMTPAGDEAPAGRAVAVADPGVYDIPAAVYHADPVPGGSLSSTGARKVLECPAKFEWDRRHPQPTRKTFDLGSAAHRVVLEDGPELVLIDAAEWRSNAVKAQVAAVREAGGIPLKPDEYRMVHDMAEALRRHPVAGPTFAPGSGRAEQSLFWRDHMTGVSRRARPDWMKYTRSGRLIAVDYKTTADASLDGISKSVLNYRYDQQAAWYRSGMRELGLHDDPGFVFVFQEKVAPYVVTVVELTAVTHKIGRARNRQALELYARCTESGYWPGYADENEPSLVALPGWAENKELEETA
jgi:PDDEXK-like domain of unknown function (DUF3799)